jgi:hypothetical protein
MRYFYILTMIVAVWRCTPAQKEEASTDSTAAVEADSSEVFFASEQNDTTAGTVIGDEYVIKNQDGYISSPFDFNLDSATVLGLLGEETVIKSRYTPAGEDQVGSYEAYTFYEVEAGDTKMNFYDYGSKHYADIYTPALGLKNNIKVGMSKDDFLVAMSIDDQRAHDLNIFSINDFYGDMSFYFENDVLIRVRVDYEEGD